MAKRKKTKWVNIGKRKRVSESWILPGVRAVEGGGWWVRGRWTEQKTGKRRELSRFLDVPKASDAYQWLQEALAEKKRGGEGRCQKAIRFSEFAASLFEAKVKRGDIQSAAGRVKWANILEFHLIPVFGSIFMSELEQRDVRRWRDECAVRARRGDMSPNSANTRLAVLRVILKAGAVDGLCAFGLAESIQPLSLRGHRTYTPEAPNALKAQDVPRFLAKMREMYPQHYAMIALGFCTGLRPSSLRPIRRSVDVRWNENQLIIRRSQTIGDEVMESTKNGSDVIIALPSSFLDILRWHLSRLATPKMRNSELLFPSRTGGYRSKSVLNPPFAKVSKEICLPYVVSSRAMRRTFQDLARAAQVADIVTRSISGHHTERMQHHYSTVSAEEQRHHLQNVIDVAFGQKNSSDGEHPFEHPISVHNRLNVDSGVHGPEFQPPGNT